MNKYEAPEMIEMQERLKPNSSLGIEVTEIHNSADIEVTHIPEYVSSTEYHIPTMKALGGAAMKNQGVGELREAEQSVGSNLHV